MTPTHTPEDLEARLAELRRRHADLTTAIGDDERDLARADAAVASAQSIYDEVLRTRAAARPTPDAYGEWTPRNEREEARAREAVQRADGLFEQADRELTEALVARTTISQRQGTRRTIRRQLEEAISQAEAKLARERSAPPERDVLAAIRARVLGQVGA